VPVVLGFSTHIRLVVGEVGRTWFGCRPRQVHVPQICGLNPWLVLAGAGFFLSVTGLVESLLGLSVGHTLPWPSESVTSVITIIIIGVRPGGHKHRSIYMLLLTHEDSLGYRMCILLRWVVPLAFRSTFSITLMLTILDFTMYQDN
jgi:hypothetical protein